MLQFMFSLFDLLDQLRIKSWEITGIPAGHKTLVTRLPLYLPILAPALMRSCLMDLNEVMLRPLTTSALIKV